MRISIFLCAFLAVCQLAGAQEFSIARVPDTLSFRDLTFPRPGHFLMQPSILLPLDFPDAATANDLPPGFSGFSSIAQLPFRADAGPLASLRHQTYRQDWWKYVYTALGAVQVGADAYFTYRALKKYGYIR